MHPSEQASHASTQRQSWVPYIASLLIVVLVAVFLWRYSQRNSSEKCPAPPFHPVTLKVVYNVEDSLLLGDNIVSCSGTAHYTFSNRWPFPVTLAFPPLCSYTYSEHSQEGVPFPGKNQHFPNFAKEHREVVIPAGKSVSFDSGFELTYQAAKFPRLFRAFVFGPPEKPCEHPVLGTVWGAVEEYKPQEKMVNK